MSTTTDPMDAQSEWWNSFAEMNEEFATALERNLDAQAAFTEAWMDSFDVTSGQEEMSDGMAGVMRAYETWMTAANESVETMADVMEGENVSAEQFRSIWLNAANQAFKDVMQTRAFAAATGQSVGSQMDLRQRVDDLVETSLHASGLPSEGDIEEVGERLVELERRQHAVEDRLDRILDALEDER